jgi:hypothetical protein
MSMKHALFPLLLLAAAAARAAAQTAAPAPSVELPDALAQALSGVQDSKARVVPAKVDPKPVAALFDRLAKDGEQIETAYGTQDAYSRDGQIDKHGRAQDLQVGVVELPDPSDADDGSGGPRYRNLVIRRVFSTLEAESKEWSFKKDGTGRVDVWHFTVSLDGYLLSVTHDRIPMAVGPGGEPQILVEKTTTESPAPSSRSVLRRWKALTKKLLTLGRATTV